MQQFEITAKANTKEAEAQLKKLSRSTEEAAKANLNLADSFDELEKAESKNREGFKLLDTITGGYSTKLIDFGKQIKGGIQGVKGLSASFKTLRTAIISTGIGALVVALGLIVAYWDEIKEFISGTNKELQKQENLLNTQIEVQRTQLGLLKQQKQLEELRTGSNEKTTEEYKKQLIVLRELQVKALENLQTQLKLEESKNKEVTLWEKTKIFAEGIVNPTSVASNLIKAQNKDSEKSLEIQEKLNKAKSELGNIDIELAQIESNENRKRQDRIKKSQDQAEKDKQDKIKAEKEKADAIERIRQGLIDTEDERRKEELRKIQANYEAQIALAEQYYGKESETVLALRQAQKDALDAQQNEFDAQDKEKAEKESQIAAEKLALDKENDLLSFEEQRAVIAQREALLLEDETINEKDRTGLQKTYSDKRKEIDQLEADFKKSQTKEIENTLASLGELAGKETAAGKALGIAAATINTFQGASEALKQESTLPSPFDVVAKIANVATVIATGLKTVKSIASVKVPGGGGGGSVPSAPSLPASQPPAFNVVGQGGTNQLAQVIGEQTQQPIQAYVVANDITSTQSLQRNIQTEAGLG
jgi:hypothetical protein